MQKHSRELCHPGGINTSVHVGCSFLLCIDKTNVFITSTLGAVDQSNYFYSNANSANNCLMHFFVNSHHVARQRDSEKCGSCSRV